MQANKKHFPKNSSSASNGYTILEVMIFLVISSFIFVAAVVAIGGQQEKTQFAQAVRDLDSRIQGVINDVGSGFFPQTDIECVVGGSISFNPSVGQQGTNKDCIFIGKAIQFARNDNPAGITVGEGLTVFTIVGRRVTGGSPELQVQSLDEADPTVAADPGNLANPLYDLTDYSTTTWGLKITNVYKIDDPSREVGLISFVSSFGKYNVAQTNLVSEARPVRFAVLGNNSTNMPTPAMVALINAQLDNTSLTDAAGGVVICLESANGNQRAAITVGENGRELATRIDQEITAGEFPGC